MGAHRIAFELANGPIPAGLLVLHSCDNRKCVNPAHLRCGTHLDNAADRNSRGRQATGDRITRNKHIPRGSEHREAKLSESQVLDIRSRHADGESSRCLARKFSMSHMNIRRIVNRVTWKHI